MPQLLLVTLASKKLLNPLVCRFTTYDLIKDAKKLTSRVHSNKTFKYLPRSLNLFKNYSSSSSALTSSNKTNCTIKYSSSLIVYEAITSSTDLITLVSKLINLIKEVAESDVLASLENP